MAQRTFDQISDQFRSAAREKQVPQELVSAVVDLHRGPLAFSDATASYVRWYTATPGDPAAELTLPAIREKFSASAEAWRQSQAAVGHVDSFLYGPGRPTPPEEIARQLPWGEWRSQLAKTLGTGFVAGEILRAAESPVQLGKQGKVKELLSENARQNAELSAWSASLLASLSSSHDPVKVHEVLLNELQAKGYPSWGAATLGRVVTGLVVPGVIVATGVGCALAGGPAGWAGAAYCWGVAGYYSKRVYDDWY